MNDTPDRQVRPRDVWLGWDPVVLSRLLDETTTDAEFERLSADIGETKRE